MSIPGLSICTSDETDGLEIASFEGNIIIPSSHYPGHCHTVKDFEKIQTISTGSYGKLYKCRKIGTNEFYMLEKPNLSIDGDIPSSWLRETNLLISLKHNNIVKYIETVVGKDLLSNFLVMEYCPVMLKHLIEKKIKAVYEYDVVKNIMKQLFQGLQYIHGALVIHRDIKEENIFFTEQGILKISGFHASRYYSKKDMTPSVGELKYRAPELLFQAKQYTCAVDMWSAGCILAKLLLKRDLFTGNSQLEILRSIFNILGTPSEAIWPGFSDLLLQFVEAEKFVQEAKPFSSLKDLFHGHTLSSLDLIKNLFVYDPNFRLSAKECIKSTYITELPNECSAEALSLILKQVMSSEKPMTVEQKVDTDFLYF